MLHSVHQTYCYCGNSSHDHLGGTEMGGGDACRHIQEMEMRSAVGGLLQTVFTPPTALIGSPAVCYIFRGACEGALRRLLSVKINR